jgi:hypothetical protein
MLIKTWPAPEFVRDIAKFIDFAQFYSRFIPNFEMRAAPLRALIKGEYTDPIAEHWTLQAEAAWNDLKDAILSDPCIQRFDHRKLVVLRTDFSSFGFGYVLLQPGNDEALVRAAQDYLLVGQEHYSVPKVAIPELKLTHLKSFFIKF